jgi:molybdopterin/thiamine biosynthesis adenylyltransferase
VEIIAIPENTTAANAGRLEEMADVIACCAPLFEERLFLNAECVRQGKPMIDGAMHELTGQLTTIVPGQTACLACRVPEVPPDWKRQFPVFGAVSGAVGCLSAMEAIKVITGIGEPLAGRLLTFDLRDMRFRTVRLARRSDCRICASK